MNRGWKEKNIGKMPSYDEIVQQHHDDEDEEAVEKADAFEAEYNFRFEQQGSSHIVTYARDLPDVMRRKDTSRAEKRKQKKEEKKSEKKKKQEELKRLKNLKMEEIRKKLDQINQLAGGEISAFKEQDLEQDFDPLDYDQKMSAAFDESYYALEDPTKKPVFDDDIDIGDIIPHGENMASDEMKPQLQKQVEKDLEEYYQLDYEDIIDDLPVRFKYRKVDADDYGLKPEEILQADDTELNQVISLKKLAPYRSEEKRKRDEQKWKKSKKKKLWEFRAKLKGNKVAAPQEEQVQGNQKLNIDATRMSSYGSLKKK